MNRKNTMPRRVQSKQISYQRMAKILLNLQIEFQLLAECSSTDRRVKATNFTTDNNIVFQFDDEDFCLSFDLVKKGGIA